MEAQILNYRVIIEPELYPGGSRVFNGYCPTLGVTDYGDTVEKVLESIKDGILLAVESLAAEGKEVPTDNLEEQIVTATQVKLPSSIKLGLA